jgi:hypothetical protein
MLPPKGPDLAKKYHIYWGIALDIGTKVPLQYALAHRRFP